MEILFLIATGLVAGVLGGMGMGGGTLLIPMLTIFFGIEQHAAQAVNLAAFIPMSIIALIIHIKNKLVDFKKALYIVIPSCVTAAAGSYAAKNTDAGLLQKLFGIFLILLALFQIVFIIIQKNKKKAEEKAAS